MEDEPVICEEIGLDYFFVIFFDDIVWIYRFFVYFCGRRNKCY